MRKSITKPLRTEQETEKSDGLETLGGEFGLSWNDTVPLTTGAHNAFLSAFVANVWNMFCRIGGDGSHKEALTTRRRLQGCVARISRHGRRNSITVYTAGKEDAASAFSAIAGFLHKITSASQLKVEQRWQLIIYWAIRKYKHIYRLYPPLLGDQIMLPLA